MLDAHSAATAGNWVHEQASSSLTTDPIVTLYVTIAMRYYPRMAIKSFHCGDTEKMYGGTRVKRFVNIEEVAMRKLAMLNAAGRLDDLKVPPGNRLEPLKGKRAGQHSIRVNDQFRICFRWTGADAEGVEIVDYH